jgi:monovalent cation/proton antiporter, MnhG/PhaG subunit
MIVETIAAILLLLGGGFALIAGLGMVRLPDVIMRMHASTKVGTLASGLTLAAAALLFADFAVTVRAIAIFLFLMLTAPIAAHMIGRAAVRIGVPLFHPDNDTPDKTRPAPQLLD